MLRRLGVLLAGGWLASCALAGHHPQKLPDGSYQASCATPLTSCLETFEKLCEWHGYDVIAASESRTRSDLREIPDVTINSDAHVRCKEPEPLFGGKHAAAPGEPQADLCREGPSRDRGAQCRELGPLSNLAPASSGPGPGADVAASHWGARASAPRASAVAGAGLFDSWPAGSSPQ